MHAVTFALLKPDVTQSLEFLRILEELPRRGFRVELARLVTFTRELAEAFYAEHTGKPFFAGLVEQMTSAPVVALLLSQPADALDLDTAIVAWRAELGATDPTKAALGTIRQQYGTAGARNAAHGSDSVVNAAREARLVFGERARRFFTADTWQAAAPAAS